MSKFYEATGESQESKLPKADLFLFCSPWRMPLPMMQRACAIRRE
jgi:hypothetical protein